MIEDPELESWREQWVSVSAPSPDFQRKVQERIKRQERRFLLGNIVTAMAFVGMLIFAVFVRTRSSEIGTGWATGICVLVIVSVGYRLWFMRGTWRAETQSTRAFVELWRKRAASRLRLLRISIYVSVGWLVICAMLTALNWRTIGVDVKAHPRQWLVLLVLVIVMQPVIGLWAAWLWRRKVAELQDVQTILDGMNG